MPLFKVACEFHHFAHVPKCAGTSLEAHLEQRFGKLALLDPESQLFVSPQHFTWQGIIDIVPSGWIASSFALVRHPVSRFVSEFNMRVAQPGSAFPRELGIGDFLDWVEARLGTNPALLDNHLRPQVDFLGPETRWFRLEEGLEAVLEDLDQRFGRPGPLPPLPRHDHMPSDVYNMFSQQALDDDRLIDWVARTYAVDFARFGYDRVPSKPPRVLVIRSGRLRSLKRAMWRLRRGLGPFVS